MQKNAVMQMQCGKRERWDELIYEKKITNNAKQNLCGRPATTAADSPSSSQINVYSLVE